MVDVIVPPRDPAVAVVEPSPPAASAASNASIDAYLGAGEGMSAIMGSTMIVCLALIVLIVVAWALGALPSAVRLF